MSGGSFTGSRGGYAANADSSRTNLFAESGLSYSTIQKSLLKKVNLFDVEPLDLTWENVDLVLEEMRP